MLYYQKNFEENELTVKNGNLKYFSSPNLVKNNFKHGFFTKTSSEINLPILASYLNLNKNNCVLNQIHSNKIVFGSETQRTKKASADGIVGDEHNQNLWIYTADCMPILFADKRKRFVAAIHCGRKGLENRIIKNLLKIFNKLGSTKEDILVAIGPSISKQHYLLDKKTLEDFYQREKSEEQSSSLKNNKSFFYLKNLIKFKKQTHISLDLKKHAYFQLLNENIPKTNIDVSLLCTYELSNDFYSWRKSKTLSRQWSFISPS